MNYLDLRIIDFINQFSQKSIIFDILTVIFQGNNLLKGGVLSTIIWWTWFERDERHSNKREKIIITLFSCVIAITLARVLALTLPFRLRPQHEESLHFLLPFGMTSDKLEGWSSFPSDHAVLFFTLSTGLIFISRRVGLISLTYTVLFIAFPRIYLGLHYPSDVLAGAIIGMTIALLGNTCFVKNKFVRSVTDWSYTKPNLFYPLFFLLTYQIADMFNNSRALIDMGVNFIRYIIKV